MTCKHTIYSTIECFGTLWDMQDIADYCKEFFDWRIEKSETIKGLDNHELTVILSHNFALHGHLEKLSKLYPEAHIEAWGTIDPTRVPDLYWIYNPDFPKAS